MWHGRLGVVLSLSGSGDVSLFLCGWGEGVMVAGDVWGFRGGPWVASGVGVGVFVVVGFGGGGRTFIGSWNWPAVSFGVSIFLCRCYCIPYDVVVAMWELVSSLVCIEILWIWLQPFLFFSFHSFTLLALS
jgi:hypothetical protein